MTIAPIPLVSALRETSIIFAVAIGVIFLKERIEPGKIGVHLSNIDRDHNPEIQPIEVSTSQTGDVKEALNEAWRFIGLMANERVPK